MSNAPDGRHAHGSEGMRMYLSIKEVAVLAELKETRIRKDIETGVMPNQFMFILRDSRQCVHWTRVFCLAAIYGNEFLNSSMRKNAFVRMQALNMSDPDMADNVLTFNRWKNHAVSVELLKHLSTYNFQIDKYVDLNMGKAVEHVGPRLDLYRRGLSRIEEKDDILGGNAVFKGTRLSVSNVGSMIARGEKVSNIVEDYPHLTNEDLEFAVIYHEAHPPVGRPSIKRSA